MEIEHIKYFFQVFKDRIIFIRNNCLKNSELTIEGLILSVSYLDALSFYKYKTKSTAKRFSDFVQKYSSQNKSDYYNKINMPLLLRRIKKKQNNSLHQRFISFIEVNIGANTGNYVNLNYDVDMRIEELCEKMNTSFNIYEIATLLEDIEQSKWSQVLWEYYRCSLIHEMRKKDEGMNIANKSGPYYSNMILIDENAEETKFGMPSKYILETLEECTCNFEKDCLDNKIDPLERL